MDKKPEFEDKDNPLDQAEHRARMRQDWHNLIEDLIQAGQEKGAFDNLAGKGKPLSLSSNVYGAELELAHSLLKDNDLAPTWISNRNQILARIAQLRNEVQETWARHEREFRIVSDKAHRGRLTISWDDACLRWQAEIEELNEQIGSFNLKRPIDNLELFKLSLESELQRAGASRWLV